MPVLSILTPLEQDAYTHPPLFSHVERKRFCMFPTSLLAIADTLRSATNRVGFLFSCAYFLATKLFFPVQSFHQNDVECIAQRWGLSAQHIDLRQYGKGLDLCPFDSEPEEATALCLSSRDTSRTSPEHHPACGQHLHGAAARTMGRHSPLRRHYQVEKTTASDLFHRLNPYSKQYTLYRALKTFEQILKSLFILRYLDEVPLCQAIKNTSTRVKARIGLLAPSRWAILENC